MTIDIELDGLPVSALPEVVLAEPADAHVRIFRIFHPLVDSDSHVTAYRRFVREVNVERDAHVRQWRRDRTSQRDGHVRDRRRHYEAAFRSRFHKRTPRGPAAFDPAIASHVMSESPVRSFRFQKPEGGSFYAYVMTWTPGNLTLTGDIGDMVLTHYNALAHFNTGMEWLGDSDYAYLMEKSDAKQVFDLDDTIGFIVGSANAEAAATMFDLLREKRKFRAKAAEAKVEFETALARWREDPDRDPDSEPAYDDHAPDEESYDLKLQVCRKAPDWRSREPSGGFIEPDGFGQWFRLWRELDNVGADVDDDPESIFTILGRRRVKLALARHLDGTSPQDVGSFAVDIGHDDWYGSYVYPAFTRLQIDALKYGAHLILSLEDRKTTGGEPPV